MKKLFLAIALVVSIFVAAPVQAEAATLEVTFTYTDDAGVTTESTYEIANPDRAVAGITKGLEACDPVVTFDPVTGDPIEQPINPLDCAAGRLIHHVNGEVKNWEDILRQRAAEAEAQSTDGLIQKK